MSLLSMDAHGRASINEPFEAFEVGGSVGNGMGPIHIGLWIAGKTGSPFVDGLYGHLCREADVPFTWTGEPAFSSILVDDDKVEVLVDAPEGDVFLRELDLFLEGGKSRTVGIGGAGGGLLLAGNHSDKRKEGEDEEVGGA